MDISNLKPKIKQASTLMRMLSQPVRLEILCTLLEGERSVLKLAADVGLSQPAMSHHLKMLRECDFVTTRRDAQTIYYSLHGNEVRTVLELLHNLYCNNEIALEDT